MVICTILVWFYSAIIVGLLKDIILWQISIPYLFLGLNMQQFASATRLGAGPFWTSLQKPTIPRLSMSAGLGLVVFAACEGWAGCRHACGFEVWAQDNKGQQPGLHQGLRTVTLIPRWRHWLHGGFTRDRKPRPVVPTVLGEKERGLCDFPFFTKKKKSA